MDKQNINCLFVGNKIDRKTETEVRDKFSQVDCIIFISAKNNLHLEVLKERMMDMVLRDTVSTENVIVTNARHYHALVQVNEALGDVMQGLENKIPGDLLALDIRRSLQYLGEITGEITNEDQLDYIFSKFCIGK
jgi:tRNA modification GTPase